MCLAEGEVFRQTLTKNQVSRGASEKILVEMLNRS